MWSMRGWTNLSRLETDRDRALDKHPEGGLQLVNEVPRDRGRDEASAIRAMELTASGIERDATATIGRDGLALVDLGR